MSATPEWITSLKVGDEVAAMGYQLFTPVMWVGKVDEIAKNKRHRKRVRIGSTWFNEWGREEPRRGVRDDRIEPISDDFRAQVNRLKRIRLLSNAHWAGISDSQLTRIAAILDETTP